MRTKWTAGDRRAALVRGAVFGAVERGTANSDAKGSIRVALAKLADELQAGTWPITSDVLDRIIGPTQPDPSACWRRKGSST